MSGVEVEKLFPFVGMKMKMKKGQERNKLARKDGEVEA